MVNPGKRMRKLHPLLDIRMGQGAVVLQPPPMPQLVGIHLRCPKHDSSHVRRFWRTHLQQLKFHNPALPVTVQQHDGRTGRLTLHFEGEDAEALKRIPKSLPHTLPRKKASIRNESDMFAELSDEEKEIAARNQSPNWRDAPTRQAADVETPLDAVKNTVDPSLAADPIYGAEILADDPGPDIDEVLAKPQPAADLSTPSSTQPPKSMYRRKVTMGLLGQTTDTIWKFFEDRARCEPVPASQEDIQQRQRLDEFFAKAEIERQRVKTGVDAMKKEKEDLKRAKGEAEKLQAVAA